MAKKPQVVIRKPDQRVVDFIKGNPRPETDTPQTSDVRRLTSDVKRLRWQKTVSMRADGTKQKACRHERQPIG